MQVSFALISVVICIALPAGIIFFLHRRYNTSIGAFFVGALTFVVSQPLTRLLLLNYLQGTSWFYIYAVTNPVAYAIFMGLTAGLFEEIAKYLGFVFLLKKRSTWDHALALGAGHAGLEAVLLVAIPYTYLLVSGKVWSIEQTSLLLAGFERLSTIILQIAMAVLVFHAINRRNLLFLALAILMHAFLDTSSVLLLVSGLRPVLIEAYIGGLAMMSLLFIVAPVMTRQGRQPVIPLREINHRQKQNSS